MYFITLHQKQCQKCQKSMHSKCWHVCLLWMNNGRFILYHVNICLFIHEQSGFVLLYLILDVPWFKIRTPQDYSEFDVTSFNLTDHQTRRLFSVLMSMWVFYKDQTKGFYWVSFQRVYSLLISLVSSTVN